MHSRALLRAVVSGDLGTGDLFLLFVLLFGFGSEWWSLGDLGNRWAGSMPILVFGSSRRSHPVLITDHRSVNHGIIRVLIQ